MSEGIHLFGSTPCKHEKYGDGRIVSTTECYGKTSTLLCEIKFNGHEGLISLYEDEIEILNDA